MLKLIAALLVSLPLNALAIGSDDLDKKLNASYKALLKAKPDYKKEITQSQKNWLKFVQYECIIDSQLINADSMGTQLEFNACIDNEIEKRTNQLNDWARY